MVRPQVEPRPLGRYLEVRRASEALAAPLSAEDCALQSMTEASPVKWHLAHTTWFFETFVLDGRRGYRPREAAYRALFNSYYQAVGELPRRDQRGLWSRPSLDEVKAYRRHVDEAMLALLEDPPAAALPLVELGLEHEEQHQELILTDVKHGLYQNPLEPAYRAPLEALPGEAAPLGFVERPGGLREIGHAGPGFSFDNERPRHRVLVEGFALATRPVTAGEWQAFIAEGGYADPRLWLSDGWAMRSRAGWQAPLYWRRRDGEWWQFTLGGPRRCDAREPVCHVSYYEADAFARWAGARLPTEAEWEVAAADAPGGPGHFADSGRFHPGPARAALAGDVWCWTQSAYAAYPGYRAPDGAIGEYNGKFMCNQLVLRGGSCLTPRASLRPSYRNFFPPEARWQMTGLWLARDLHPRRG